MNNNINESFCSPEVTKLLYEKGFDVRNIDRYQPSEGGPSYPSQSIVREWIWVNFGIWIFCDWTQKWFWTIQVLKDDFKYIHQEDLDTNLNLYNGFDVPYHAIDSALLYTLTNLI